MVLFIQIFFFSSLQIYTFFLISLSSITYYTVSSFTEKRRTRFPASLSKQEKLEYDNTWKGTIRKANLFSIAVHGALLGGAFRTEWIGTSLEIDGMIDRQELFNYVENLKNLALFKQIGFVALSPEAGDTTYRWVLDRLKANGKAVLLHNEKIDEPVHNELYVALVPIAGAVPSCLKAHKLPSGEFLLMVVVSSATV